MSRLASLLLCVSMVVPSVAMADGTVRGDVRVRVELPKIVTRDSSRPPPRNYVRFDNDKDSERVDRSRVVYDIGGEYDSFYGRVSLQQDGNRVTGRFDDPGHGGIIKGRIRGNAVYWRWKSDSGTNAEGTGVWYLNGRGNKITGSWGTYGSRDNAGKWDLDRVGVSHNERWERRRRH